MTLARWLVGTRPEAVSLVQRRTRGPAGDREVQEMAQWMQKTLAASASVTTVAVLVAMVGAGSKWW